MQAASPELLRSFRSTEVASNDLPQSPTSRFARRLASSRRVTTQGRVHPASSSQSVSVEGILVTADKGFTILLFVEILVAVVRTPGQSARADDQRPIRLLLPPGVLSKPDVHLSRNAGEEQTPCRLRLWHIPPHDQMIKEGLDWLGPLPGATKMRSVFARHAGYCNYG